MMESYHVSREMQGVFGEKNGVKPLFYVCYNEMGE